MAQGHMGAVLWSGYLATWMVLTGSGPTIVVLWWLAGLGLLQLITQPLYHTGRIEPSRRHGPFDPSVSPRPDPPLPLAGSDDQQTTPEGTTPAPFGIRGTPFRTGNRKAAQSQNHSAPTRPPRPPNAITKGRSRPMSKLIDTIRHWLHLDRKPKT